MTEEVWRRFRNTWYEVSNLGRVVSTKYCKKNERHELSYFTDKDGYLSVGLMIDKKQEYFRVHRLVLECFVGKSNLQVNHKNEIKNDNRLENLEYCTQAYNNNYGTRNQKVSDKLSKPVVQMDLLGNEIKVFKSATEVDKELGFDFRNISLCCNGHHKTAYGYRWKFLGSQEEIGELINGHSKAVIQMDLNNNIIKEFPSLTEAQKQTNVNRAHIGDCCKGKRLTAGGYKWKYA